MKLLKYLANLGYGSRRTVTSLIEAERVTRRDGTILTTESQFSHDEVLVDGEPLDVAPGSVLMLHKPVGYVCSTRDASNLVYELLPPRLPLRTPVMAPIGRLDRETSGLLLLTDDGRINHRITSPRTQLPKVYEARLANDLRGDEAAIFASGTMMLESEIRALEPARLEIIGAREARVTVTEGRYHQVRRMFAAVGNHVESLHRAAVGTVSLGELPAGNWRILTSDEIRGLLARSVPLSF